MPRFFFLLSLIVCFPAPKPAEQEFRPAEDLVQSDLLRIEHSLFRYFKKFGKLPKTLKENDEFLRSLSLLDPYGDEYSYAEIGYGKIKLGTSLGSISKKIDFSKNRSFVGEEAVFQTMLECSTASYGMLQSIAKSSAENQDLAREQFDSFLGDYLLATSMMSICKEARLRPEHLMTQTTENLDKFAQWARSAREKIFSEDAVQRTEELGKAKNLLNAMKQSFTLLAEYKEIPPVILPAPPPPPQELEDFNELRCAVLDFQNGTVRLAGRRNPQGPREMDLPYTKLLASALRLPPDQGTPGAVGSVPGFSLEPIGDWFEGLEALMANQETMMKAVMSHMGSNPEYADFLFPQVKKYIVEYAKTFFRGRVSEKEIEDIFRSCNSFSDLPKKAGVLKQQFKPGEAEKFATELQRIVTEKTSEKGTSFVLPPKLIAEVFNKHVYATPTYFGIANNTQYARIIFDADLLLKTIAGPSGATLKSNLPYHLSFSEYMFLNSTSQEMNTLSGKGGMAVIQFIPGKIELEASSDGSTVQFKRTELKIAFLARDGSTANRVYETYGQFLDSHLEDYLQISPAIWNLRELYKVTALAKFIKQRGMRISLQEDDSWSSPTKVPGEIGLVCAGQGPNAMPLGGFAIAGGITLQIEKKIQVTESARNNNLSLNQNGAIQLNNEALFAQKAGPVPQLRAPDPIPGYPIVSKENLSLLSTTDLRANIKAQSDAELEMLASTAAKRADELEAKIAELKKSELILSMKNASPTPQESYPERFFETLPGVKTMQQWGEAAAQELSRQTQPAAESSLKTIHELKDLLKAAELVHSGFETLDGGKKEELLRILAVPKGTELSNAETFRLFKSKLKDSKQVFRTTKKALDGTTATPAELALTTASVGLELFEGYKILTSTGNWEDRRNAALPHFAQAAQESLPSASTVGRLSGKLGYSEAGAAAVAARRYLPVAVIVIELGSTAMDVKMMNDMAKDEKQARQVLAGHVASSRAGLELEKEGQNRLNHLVREEQARRANK